MRLVREKCSLIVNIEKREMKKRGIWERMGVGMGGWQLWGSHGDQATH